MEAIVLFAVVTVGALALLLARYSAPSAAHARNRDPRPAVPRASLRGWVVELLHAMGLDEEAPVGADDDTLVARKKDPLGDIRYLVILPPVGDDGVVDQATVLSAAESIRGEGASRGMLITVGEIETAGLAALDPALELIDGPRFRQLVARFLPERLPELDRYRSFSVRPAASPATRPTPA